MAIRLVLVPDLSFDVVGVVLGGLIFVGSVVLSCDFCLVWFGDVFVLIWWWFRLFACLFVSLDGLLVYCCFVFDFFVGVDCMLSVWRTCVASGVLVFC